MGNEYDPATHAPGTVDEAKQFARYFDGQRPPTGHPINFEKLMIPRGLAPLGDFTSLQGTSNRKKEIFSSLQSRLKVPAFPLFQENNSITAIQTRLEKRSALSNFFRDVTEAGGLNGTQKDIETGLFTDGPLEEIFFMVFRNQDNRTWQMWPVIISDLGKDTLELEWEIDKFLAKHDRSDAQAMQMNMKQVAYYLFTGAVREGV